MNEEVVTLLKYQHEMLEKIAQLLQDNLDQSKAQHIEMKRLGESMEGFLSMIQGNTE